MRRPSYIHLRGLLIWDGFSSLLCQCLDISITLIHPHGYTLIWLKTYTFTYKFDCVTEKVDPTPLLLICHGNGDFQLVMKNRLLEGFKP